MMDVTVPLRPPEPAALSQKDPALGSDQPTPETDGQGPEYRRMWQTRRAFQLTTMMHDIHRSAAFALIVHL